MLTHFSLFSGIGGIDLAAEWAGFQTVGQCEIDPYCRRVLAKHWPGVPIWEDVRDVTADNVRGRGIDRIDLLSGGFPCQPHSVAGKRKSSLDERDLWGEFARVIREVRPRWVLGENVPGLLSSESGRFFGRVLGDLAAMGYHAGWCGYGAADVGAPHRRERVFIVAYSRGGGFGEPDICPQQQRGTQTISAGEDVGNSISFGLPGEPRRGAGAELADGHQQLEKGDVADTQGEQTGRIQQRGISSNIGASGNQTGQAACRPVEPRLGGVAHELPAGMDGRWPAGLGAEQYDWEPPRIAAGVKNRVARLKALGNTVCPQQVYPILAAIAKIEGGLKHEA